MFNKKIKSILFVISSPKKKENYIDSLPPLGVLSIAALLKSNNFKVGVIDCNIERMDKFNLDDFDLIGFSVMVSNVENTLRIAKEVKKKFPKKMVVVGGPHASSNPTFFIEKDFIDLVVVGEGELTMLELMKKQNHAEVKGLFFRDEKGKIIFTGNRERIRNLNMLPFPDLSMVDYKKYDVPIKKKKPISSIITARGCPFSCTFCLHSLGRLWVARSPKNVVDEIEYQVKNFGIKEICIVDDNFTMDAKRAKRICDLIIKRGIKVKLQLTNGIRVDRIDRELVQRLKDCGLWLIGVAPESGNPKTLKKIKKKFDLEKVKEVIKWCHESGLNTHSFFMVGFPWETKENVQQTIDFALKLDTDITQFSRVVAFPGTKLFEQMSLDTNEGFDRDKGLFYGGVGHKLENIEKEEIHQLIKRGYRTFFLKPKRMWRLLRVLSIIDLFKLLKYAITSESI